jgi:cell division cycle 14
MQATRKIEIIKDRLFWMSDAKTPRGEGQAFFFCIDDDLVYQPFFKDFGPLNLGNTYRFVTELEKLLGNKDYSKNKIIHYTSLDVAKRANAAYLMCAFQVITLNKTALEAWAPFSEVEPPFKPFRDASYTNCSYQCTILHCLQGLEYAMKLGWFDIKTFNIKEYEHYEDIDHGDLNWIVPGKFVAFCTPSDSDKDQYMSPDEYSKIFKALKVTAVVRLNNPLYDGKKFHKAGINHYSLEYEDGSCPDEDKWTKFLEVAEKEPTVAIHCKAGLGRTGSMIALYCMKHFRFPAAAFIGWIRICRPGSVLGPQQQWLNMMQDKMFQLGEATSPIQKTLDKDVKQLSLRLAQMSIKQEKMNDDEKKTYQQGQAGQGEFLTQQKLNKKS